jgi:hypothetical protein
MADACEHKFEDALAMFTGTTRTRVCGKCDHVEVMLTTSAEWVDIERFLRERVSPTRAT